MVVDRCTGCAGVDSRDYFDITVLRSAVHQSILAFVSMQCYMMVHCCAVVH